MIVIDTNIISEMVAVAPSSAVEAWLAAQPPMAIFTTTVTQAEILFGLGLLPHGRRRRDLEAAILPIFDQDLAGRILPFDSAAAETYAAIAVARREAGRPISQFDAQIAAIASSRGAVLATRNASDFEGIALEIVNPWSWRG
ncbi:type II toxin-antitoxin system VapC family toxin [Boseaceae bacterium BT-24-1]|nr:type II toxin-antitoxin system VapC family toxin [Boseaceae bacterium BT-24-1]